MSINGVTITQADNYAICCVDDFSDELKDVIRKELNAICFGKRAAGGLPGIYSYEKTLKEFLVRYDKTTPKIQVGMMGELLAHILVGSAFSDLEPISRLFNKEERHIKKGFDLNFLGKSKDSIWYGEVKSGEKSDLHTVDSKHKDLLGTAKRDLLGKFKEGKLSLWDNALNDVSLVLATKKAKSVSQLLQKDFLSLEKDSNLKKNAVLISSLFHSSKDRPTEKTVAEHTANLLSKGEFSGVLVLCIQKTAYSTIVDFLREEAKDEE